VVLAIFAGACYAVRKFRAKIPDYVPLNAVLVLAGVFALMLVSNQLYWVITDFLNPEYFAWREVRR
jgi:hypothetical protein